jgi:hypothetical protein
MVEIVGKDYCGGEHGAGQASPSGFVTSGFEGAGLVTVW